MNKEKINRINELSKKSRSCPLSAGELCEQKALRDEYRRNFIGNLTDQLENITLVKPDGEKIPVKDLKKDDEKKG
jgi:uncharacterized protein YnzC (UPF0291/DUF896 family)